MLVGQSVVPHVKRILVLAYYFPPLGGAGVQRTLKLVKHLGELGYEATVVAGNNTTELDWAPRDPTLTAEIPTTARILRTPEPPEFRRCRGRLSRWLGQSPPFDRWWGREATSLARTVVGDTDLVYATMSPFGTASAAAAIAREAGLPWVADLRDPWALDEWAVYPSGVHRVLDRRRMHRALRSADAVIMNTTEAACALRAVFPDFARKRVLAIPNGWDRDDFASDPPDADPDRIKIVYAGYAHVAAGRRHQVRRVVRTVTGGAVRGLDVLARSHLFLLEALAQLRTLDPELASRVELHVAGPVSEGILVQASVDVYNHGYLTHGEVLGLIRSADILFLPMHDLASGTRSRAVPGKTYEYLASERSILAAVPDGDARDLLARTPGVWLCRPRDIEGMLAALAEIAALERPVRWRRDLERYERRALAAEFAALFDELLEGGARREPGTS